MCDPGPYFATCFKDRRHLILDEGSDIVWKGDEPEYHAIAETCGDFDYEGRLYIDEAPHFFALASPKEEAVAAGCPFLAASSGFGSDATTMHKQMFVWREKDVGETIFMKESLSMGTFKAAEIVHAFDEADASNGDKYEVLSNNCAGLLISMASNLGVKIDGTVTAFVTRRLLEEKASGIVGRIKESINYKSLFQGRHLVRSDGLSDEQLLELAVERQVSE